MKILDWLRKPFTWLTKADPEAQQRLREQVERRKAGGFDSTKPGGGPGW